MTTVTVSPKFEVVIPPVICEALGIRPGQRVWALQHKDRIELIPLERTRKVGRGPNAKSSQEKGSYAPRTELGRRLVELRNRGIRAGIKLLSIRDINEEVARRRGGSRE